MSLDPIQTTQAITESYLNYLSTTFRLGDMELQRQFDEALRTPDKFVKGPILEATPPFEAGSTIDALIQEGVLSPHFRALRSEKLPLDRPLYQHQEEAIRKVVLHDRSIVVATGTGSGKTEAFLVPILNH
ncbi:MAG: DEAD/DEAH box helicase, partial [bacterium]